MRVLADQADKRVGVELLNDLMRHPRPQAAVAGSEQKGRSAITGKDSVPSIRVLPERPEWADPPSPEKEASLWVDW